MSSHVKVHFKLVQDEDGYPPVATESVWATPAGEADEFVLDNVPFFARDATLGDTVVAPVLEGHRWFRVVSRRSTNSLIRVVFFEPSAKERVDRALQALGCGTEYLGAHSLLAVSVPASTPLHDVQTYLKGEAGSGSLDYEEPILRQ